MMIYVVGTPNGVKIADANTPHFNTFEVYGTFEARDFALARRLQAGCASHGIDGIWDAARRDAPGTACEKSLVILREMGW